MYITEDDICICQELNINILSSEISFDNINTPYMNWQSISPEMFLKPYTIKSKSTKKSNKLQLMINDKHTWIGNTNRGIINYIRKNNNKPECNKQTIEAGIKRSSEWLILPVQVVSSF